MLQIPDPETSLQLSRVFAAPRERVFNVWTDETLMPQWLGGTHSPGISGEVDLRVGGRYRIGINTPDMGPIYIVGEYREIVVPEKLVYTWAFEQTEPETAETLVTVQFIDLGDTTRVDLIHERFPMAEVRDHHKHGWFACFDALDLIFNN